MTTASTPAPTITERLVAALTAAWRAIQAQHPEVPDTVLTLGSGTLSQRGATVLGHFAAGRWQLGEDKQLPELFVGGEGLRAGAADVLATLLHEAGHGLAAVRHVKDTSREGRYHNAKFKALAEELGLAVAEDGNRGWSGTTLPPATAERYAEQVAQLAKAITAYRHPEGQAGGGGTAKSRNNIVATCECPRRIRVARAVLAQAPIVCSACDAEFTAKEDDEET
jgi:hypothetical protein